ncbi:hypothetical protein VTN77DRAFT_5426 [Rasamsonia byssochlamydoides]|uniref:uncharacterized protein n=1 Tax=Rasamsonia byssochlamydoides TaxID=89139 RepID=UPI003743D0A0
MAGNLLYSRPSFHIPPPQSEDPQSPSRLSKQRSPVFADESDPLLGNLSPESILDALSAINAVSKHEKQAKDLLVKTISQVSNEERTLGARAAIAAQKLREWLKEVQEWRWPVGKDVQLGKGFIPPPASPADTSQPTCSEPIDSGTEYLGSLPAEIVARYETRIEEIRDGMDSLDVEELKEHVLNVHIPMRSRPSSSTSIISVAPPPLSYVQLSDFNAVITATILRALPTLSRLNILLDTWEVRLLVLHQIPGLLMALKSARAALDSSRSSLKDPSENGDLFNLDMFHSKKDELEQMVLEAGRKMDRILDALEGRKDCLPEAWIDDLEAIEADFAAWVVEAEGWAVGNEWKRCQAQDQQRRDADVSVSPPNETKQNERSTKPTENLPSECEDKDKPVTEPQANPSDEKVVVPDSESNDTTTFLNDDATVVSEALASTSIRDTDTVPAEAAEQTESNNEVPPSRVEIQPTSQPESSLIASNISQKGDDTLAPTITAEDKADSSSGLARETEATSSVKVACRDTLDGAADSGSESNVLDSGLEVTKQSPSTELPECSNKVEDQPVRGEETAEFGIDSRLPEAADIVENPHESALETKTSVGQAPTTPKRASRFRPVIPDSVETAQSSPEEQTTRSTEFSGSHVPANDASLERDAELLTSPSIDAPTPGLTLNSSPGLTSLTSTDSDSTMREGSSPRLEHQLRNRRSFRDTKTASLPLQRFINDGVPANYEVNDGFQADFYSTPRRDSDASVGTLVKNESEREETPSPPLDVIPRPALRQQRSGLAKGTSSTQSEPSPSIQKGNAENSKSNAACNPRQRLASSQDVDPGSSSKNAAALRSPMAIRVAGDLRSQPSIESIGSITSNSEAGDVRSTHSLPVEDESFAMKPFSETDDQLQEKINSILTNIPARIRLSSTPAYDSDQRSTTSSTSASKRERLGPRSSFSTPSRSTTPTPSLTLAPAPSRPRRAHAHASEEKTVRVYHLHQRGKTAPTKLFVRSVGEDGGRVMVRVGGGWADLGEYLREYVHHHGRRAISGGRVEVQDLPTPGSPTTSSSPGSTKTSTRDNGRSSPLSRPGSVLSSRPSSSLAVGTRPSSPLAMRTRPASSLEVHKTRRPELTAANIQKATENTPPARDPSRRFSVSSFNSVGDGASVYSPYHSTPLGLAGPKPRSRHMSMSPESEAWVEDVLGRARRASSSQKQVEHQPGARTVKDRRVSDIGTAGRNKRVLLRGLGSRLDQE